MTSTIQSPNCLYFSSLPSEEVINYPNDLSRKGNHCQKLRVSIPWTEKPGGLQSMGSLRVGHDWVTSVSVFTFMHWRRKWQSTPVFLPGESQGRGSLVGCRLWGPTNSDTTEGLSSIASRRGMVFLRGSRGGGTFITLFWRSYFLKVFKNVFTTDLAVFKNWKTVNDMQRSLTGHWLKKWQWSQERTLI